MAGGAAPPRLTRRPELDVVLPSWLSWIRPKPAHPPWPEMIRVPATLMVPLLLGLALGHLELAIFVGIGALRVSVGTGGPVARRVAHVGGGAAFALAGFAVGRLAGGDGVVPVIVLAALGAITAMLSSGGGSLPFAGSQLIIFASISGGLPRSVPLPLALAALAVGGAWGLATSLAQAVVVGASARSPAAGPGRTASTAGTTGTTGTCGIRARLARADLRALLGPQTRSYGARLTLTLAVADVVRQLAPFDNAYWVLLTVAVVFKPDSQPLARGLQRTVGTLVGAGIGAGILALRPGTAWLFVALAILAVLLPYCILRNYGMYATFLTPLVLLLLDLPTPITSGLILGRLADTALGAGVVIVVGYLVWPDTWSRGRDDPLPRPRRGSLPA